MREVEASRDASPLVVTDNVLSLKSTGLKSKGSSALHNAIRASSTHTPLVSDAESRGYAINITFGGQDFEAIFDTGSSDLWLPETDVKCVNINDETQQSATCRFGPLAGAIFQDGAIAKENFRITHRDHQFVTGVLGYEDVGVANITVQRQAVALVKRAHWHGNNVTSGLMGFAYPALTNAYPKMTQAPTIAIPRQSLTILGSSMPLINI